MSGRINFISREYDTRFSTSVFFMTLFPPAPSVSHWVHFDFFTKIRGDIRNSGDKWETFWDRKLVFILCWDSVGCCLHLYNDFFSLCSLGDVGKLILLQIFNRHSPVSLLPTINYRRSLCYQRFIIADVVVNLLPAINYRQWLRYRW